MASRASSLRSVLVVGGGLFAAAAPPLSGPLAAQETFTLAGRVVAAGTNDGVAGVVVTLDEARAVGTDVQGWFRFRGVGAGEHALRTHGVGYHPTELRLEVRGDTVVHLEVSVSPVPLDPLVVSARTIDVRGRVREAASGAMVVDARIHHAAGGETETDRAGRFRFSDFPAEVPVPLWVEAFGFLPGAAVVEAASDTALSFELERDPVAEAIIREQMHRIDARAEGFRYEVVPVMERDEILEYRDLRIDEMLPMRLGSWVAERIVCVVVDEEAVSESQRARNRYATLTGLRVHRLELTEMPGFARGLMLRIYTRDFVRDLVVGRAALVDRELSTRVWADRCR